MHLAITGATIDLVVIHQLIGCDLLVDVALQRFLNVAMAIAAAVLEEGRAVGARCRSRVIELLLVGAEEVVQSFATAIGAGIVGGRVETCSVRPEVRMLVVVAVILYKVRLQMPTSSGITSGISIVRCLHLSNLTGIHRHLMPPMLP